MLGSICGEWNKNAINILELPMLESREKDGDVCKLFSIEMCVVD